MRLMVKSRYRAERELPPEDPHVIISIYNPGKSRPNPKVNMYTVGVKYIAFDDADRQLSPTDAAWTVFDGNPILFTPEMAYDTVRFITNSLPTAGVSDHELKRQTVFTHCEAGQSRSAGMAAAIAKYYNGDDSEFFVQQIIQYSHTPLYTPNMLVHRLMLMALNDMK